MFLKNKNIIFKIRISKVTDYAALNNPTPNFKYPILVSIIEEKYMKIFDARGYFTLLALSC